MKNILTVVLISIITISIVACNQTEPKENGMFIDKVQKLINAKDEDSEEVALGELLVVAKQTGINYGYRVMDLTKNQRVEPEKINSVLGNKLQVTIFVGDEPPYKEFTWLPKYNGHITRLIVP